MRRFRLAVWVGLLAIFTQAYVPICFAFELARMVAPSDVEHSQRPLRYDPSRLPAESHHSKGQSNGSHKGCLICQGALGSGTCLAPSGAELPLPLSPELSQRGDGNAQMPREAESVPYRSRGPPDTLRS
jgi:hypothetical protein